MEKGDRIYSVQQRRTEGQLSYHMVEAEVLTVNPKTFTISQEDRPAFGYRLRFYHGAYPTNPVSAFDEAHASMLKYKERLKSDLAEVRQKLELLEQWGAGQELMVKDPAEALFEAVNVHYKGFILILDTENEYREVCTEESDDDVDAFMRKHFPECDYVVTEETTNIEVHHQAGTTGGSDEENVPA